MREDKANYYDKGETHFGSSNLDDLLKNNVELLPDDVRQALLSGRSVQFNICAIVGPVVHEPVGADDCRQLQREYSDDVIDNI